MAILCWSVWYCCLYHDTFHAQKLDCLFTHRSFSIDSNNPHLLLKLSLNMEEEELEYPEKSTSLRLTEEETKSRLETLKMKYILVAVEPGQQ